MVGLGGSGTNDGGAGLLAALGRHRRPAASTPGPPACAASRSVDLGAAASRLGGRRAGRRHATWTTRCTGLFGATKVFGPQKGIAEERLPAVDGVLEELAAADRPAYARWRRAPAPPAASASRCCCSAPPARPGIDLVPTPSACPSGPGGADLVITGEGAFDFSSRSGKVPYGVAQVAAEALRPCIALAGQVLVGSREMRALGRRVGVLAGRPGGGGARLRATRPAALAELAERVARTWSR